MQLQIRFFTLSPVSPFQNGETISLHFNQQYAQ